MEETKQLIEKLMTAVLVNVNGWGRKEAEEFASKNEGSELWEEFESILKSHQILPESFLEKLPKGRIRSANSRTGVWTFDVSPQRPPHRGPYYLIPINEITFKPLY